MSSYLRRRKQRCPHHQQNYGGTMQYLGQRPAQERHWRHVGTPGQSRCWFLTFRGARCMPKQAGVVIFDKLYSARQSSGSSFPCMLCLLCLSCESRASKLLAELRSPQHLRRISGNFFPTHVVFVSREAWLESKVVAPFDQSSRGAKRG
jgi:hypothetical protein